MLVLWTYSQPRGTWKYGKIIQLVSSTDGKIRSAIVQLSKNKNLQRPNKLLYPLEMCLDNGTPRNSEPAEQTIDMKKTKLKQQPAVDAKVKIRNIARW